MAFKMKGFNPGKGTGIGNGFSRVTLNPATRDDPEGITIGNPDGMGGATVDGETLEDLSKKKQDSKTNEMMFEDLTNRLEEYKDDPFKVEVGPAQAYEKGGTKGMFREWLKSMNPKQIKQLKDDGVLPYNYDHKKNYNFTKGTKLARLYDKKINEAINIDNDLKMSADQGYGFNEEQLQDYGIYGMEDFGGKDNKVTTSLDDYAPNPQMAGNIERNQDKLEIETVRAQGKKRMNRLMSRIKDGKDLTQSDVAWLVRRGDTYPELNKEFNEFIHNNVQPYVQGTYGDSKKKIKNSEKFDELIASGMSVQDAFKEIGVQPESTEGKKIVYTTGKGNLSEGDTGGGLLDDMQYSNRQFLFDDSPGLDLSADNKEYSDDTTDMMDQDIASMNQNKFSPGTPPASNEEKVAIGSGDEGENIVEETETKKEKFDPRDTNEDGEVDRFEMKAAKRAAMFADQSDPQSSMTKWNNKNLENMAKQTLMNADVNPFKFGSKEHEEYTNNKSRAKGLAIKQRYNKFL